MVFEKLKVCVFRADTLTMAQETEEIVVVGPAGGRFTVMTKGEETLFNHLADTYTAHNSFVNISDQQDLERIIYLEVLSLRFANWLSTESDYNGELIDPKIVTTQMKDFSGELRQLKKSVGIDKPSRQREHSESVSDFIEQLKVRAKEFGVAREEMLTCSLTLFNELIARVTLMENTDEKEQLEQKCGPEDFFGWLRDVAIPEFQEIDKHFIDNAQRMWIRSQ